LDGQEVLAGWSSRFSRREPDHDPDGCESCLTVIEYYKSQPAAALAARSDQDPHRTAAEVASHLLPHAPILGLVACDRSADIPTALGWDGPANYGEEIARYSAVMRTWEDRFNTRVVAMYGASLVCSVASPPRVAGQAFDLALEHLAVCPDLAGEFESVNAYATALIGTSMWSFWWD
jgi:hypothetical protein